MNEIIKRPSPDERAVHRYELGERHDEKPRVYFAMAPTNGERQRILYRRVGSRNRLYSFHTATAQKSHLRSFIEELEACRKMGFHLFLDSGAFSLAKEHTLGTGKVFKGDYERMAKAGSDIDAYTEAYVKFCDEEGWRFDVYANLDYVQRSAVVWDMQEKLQSLGLHPIPTIHGDDGLHWVERYIDSGHTYLGVSAGARRGSYAAIFPYLDAVFELAAKHGTKLHGYAMTSPKVIVQYPWYSVDSSTFLKTAINAQVFAPRPDKGYNRLHIRSVTGRVYDWLDELMAEKGFDWPIMTRTDETSLGPAYMERLCWNMYVLDNLSEFGMSRESFPRTEGGTLLGDLA